MGKQRTPDHHFQTIIELGDFEKSTMRQLMQDLRQTGTDQAQLAAAIQNFAAEIGLDFISSLLNSPSPRVKAMGQLQRAIATNLAVGAIETAFNGLSVYLNDEGLTPIERKRVLREFTATKQGFGNKLSDFNTLPDNLKAAVHLERVRDWFREEMRYIIDVTVNGLNANPAAQISVYEKGVAQRVLSERGAISYPLEVYPPLIGMTYAHATIEETFAKHIYPLGGIEGDELSARLAEINAMMKAHLSAPIMPEHGKMIIAAHQLNLNHPAPGRLG